MALNASSRKPKKSEQLDPNAAANFQHHLAILGLTTVAEYTAWCTQHGFACSTNKSKLQREAEVLAAKRIIAEARMSQKKREQRSFRGTLQAIFKGELQASQVSSPSLKIICEAYESLQASVFVRQALLELLVHVGETTDLIQVAPVISQYGREQGNTYLAGLLALAHHAVDWIRRPSQWKLSSHNVDRQFQSLARHLFARWPVPAFMDSVWFQGTSSGARLKQEWFIHLARGENIRTAKLPIPYTKRMSHHFMQAPSDYTVEEALRWGQIRALGGNARLIKAVLATQLQAWYQHDDFWTTVFQFLIANPMLDVAQVGPIVDYLQNEKYTPQEVFVAPNQLERRPPAQPNLTMKGRTPDALLRSVEAWHRTLIKTAQPPAEWAPSGINGFKFIEGSEEGRNLKVWTIAELLSSAALISEGKKMRHCVASYARSCVRGDCSIWALELESIEGRSKVLTLEVWNASKILVQARGRYNVLPNQKERGILNRWAEQAGLQMAKWI